MNIEASNIQTKTIGAGYEKVGDSFIKVNTDAKLNLISKDETTATEEGSYNKSVDLGKTMAYQGAKAYATVSIGKYIGGKSSGYEGAVGKGNQFIFDGSFSQSIPLWGGQVYDQQIFEKGFDSGLEKTNINPSFIDKPDYSYNTINKDSDILNLPLTEHNSIFNMEAKIIEIDNTINTNLIGDTNVLD